MGPRESEDGQEEELRRVLPARWKRGVFEWRGVWEGGLSFLFFSLF